MRSGVHEYYLYDPESIVFDGQLLGFRLNEEGDSKPIEADDDERLLCEELNLYLKAEGRTLRLIDAETGRPLLSPDEEKQAAVRQARAARKKARIEACRAGTERERADAEAAKAKTERERADAEAAKAKTERERAEASEAEVTRLREMLKQRGINGS